MAKKKKIPLYRRLLKPLVPAYEFALYLRERRLESGQEAIESLAWPVISIGNLSTGGTGKTPFAIALAKALKERGFAVDVLSRGYGRKEEQPLRVAVGGTVQDFGDEPLLIAREADVPVFVAPQRIHAGRKAEIELIPERRAALEQAEREYAALQAAELEKALEEGEDQPKQLPAETSSEEESAEGEPTEEEEPHALAVVPHRLPGIPDPDLPPVHILDDGFQHRQLNRSINILLFNRDDWQDRLLPVGNLREPHYAANRATVIVIPREDELLEKTLREWGWQGPIWKIHRTVTVEWPDALREHKSEEKPSNWFQAEIAKKKEHELPKDRLYAAFCGIARPEQFFQSLREMQIQLAGEYAFPDHHPFQPNVVKEMIKMAAEAGAKVMITTEKDQIRLGPLVELFKPKVMPLLFAKLKIEIEKQDEVLNWLTDRLLGRPEETEEEKEERERKEKEEAEHHSPFHS